MYHTAVFWCIRILYMAHMGGIYVLHAYDHIQGVISACEEQLNSE